MEFILTIGPDDPDGIGVKSISGQFFFMKENQGILSPLFVGGEIPVFSSEENAHKWLKGES